MSEDDGLVTVPFLQQCDILLPPIFNQQSFSSGENLLRISAYR